MPQISLVILPTTVFLLVLLLIQVARFAAHRSSHPYDEGDIKRARKEAIIGSQRTRGGQAAEQIATREKKNSATTPTCWFSV